MESYELETGQTIPKQMPFEDSEDRRSHPRVPISAPIRLGPPNDVVCSLLQLEDLSIGGMFIRCPEPVQVGARFSAELELPNGRSVYVPEAEVRYNRDDSKDRTPGFGAAFIDLSPEVRACLSEFTKFDSRIQPGDDVTGSMILYAESEIPSSEYDDSEPPVMPRVSDLRLASRVPNVPQAKTVQVEDWQVQIKPGGVDLDEENFDTDTTFIRPTSEADVPTDEIRANDLDDLDVTEPPLASARDIDAVDVLRHELCLAEEAPKKQRPRPHSRHRSGARHLVGLVALCAGIALVVVKLIDSATSSPDAYAEVPTYETNGLSAKTHSALLDTDSSYLGLEPKDDAKARSTTGESRHALPPLVDVEALAPKHATADKHAPKLYEPPMPKTKGSTHQKEKKTVAKAEPKPTKHAARVGVESSSGRTTIGIEDGARLKRSFALKSPPRFVVDVEGQIAQPSVGDAPAGVSRIRVGRHDGYTRLVFDVDAPLKSAKATQNGGKIEVRLSL